VRYHAKGAFVKSRVVIWLISLGCMLNIGACATSPTGDNQLQLFSSQQLAQMGKVSYEKMGRKMEVERSAAVNRYVNCVVREVTSALPGAADNQTWEVTVYNQDDTVNAYALPGGYIGIFSVLLQVAENPDQLAVVVGHEKSLMSSSTLLTPGFPPNMPLKPGCRSLMLFSRASRSEPAIKLWACWGLVARSGSCFLSAGLRRKRLTSWALSICPGPVSAGVPVHSSFGAFQNTGPQKPSGSCNEAVSTGHAGPDPSVSQAVGLLSSEPAKEPQGIRFVAFPHKSLET
jgi:hypothetical protein